MIMILITVIHGWRVVVGGEATTPFESITGCGIFRDVTGPIAGCGTFRDAAFYPSQMGASDAVFYLLKLFFARVIMTHVYL
jgi:hypothetical protein